LNVIAESKGARRAGIEGQGRVVTGAASGIGRAIAKRLAQEGCRSGCLMSMGRRRAVVAEIKAAGGRADFEACDITKYDLVQAAISALEARMGPPWTLVNNAGWDTPMPFLKDDTGILEEGRGYQLLGPDPSDPRRDSGMTKRRAGRVIFISSDAGRVGSSGESSTPVARGPRSPSRKRLRGKCRAITCC